MFQLTIVPVLSDVDIFFSSIIVLSAKGKFLGCATVVFSGRCCQRVSVCLLAVTGIKIVDNLAFPNTRYKRFVNYVLPNRSLMLFKVHVSVSVVSILFVAGMLKYDNVTSSVLGFFLCQPVNGFRRFE
jgi:hypothetical protein